MRKNRFHSLLWLLLAFLLVLTASSGAEQEIRGYIKGKGWQYLMLGEYPYDSKGTVQPVKWRILSVEDNKAFLLTEYIIDTSQVIFESDPNIIKRHAYRRISSFEESDLYPLIDTEYYNRLFSNEPAAAAIVNDPDHGRLFMPDSSVLLTPAYGFSASRYVNDKKGEVCPSHQAKGTEYAVRCRGLSRNKNGMSCYWLSSLKQGDQHYFMQLVGYDGHLSWGAYTRDDVGIRLSVYLDLTQVSVVGGDGTSKDPFILAYTGNMPAGGPENTAEPEQAPEETPGPDPVPEETPAPEMSPVPESQDSGSGTADTGTAVISLIGDCSIGDAIQSYKSKTSYHSVVAREGYAWPFSRVLNWLAEDDLTVANLEVVLTERTKHKDKKYPLRASPDHTRILLEGSVEVVNTVGNNDQTHVA